MVSVYIVIKNIHLELVILRVLSPDERIVGQEGRKTEDIELSVTESEENLLL